MGDTVILTENDSDDSKITYSKNYILTCKSLRNVSQ